MKYQLSPVKPDVLVKPIDNNSADAANEEETPMVSIAERFQQIRNLKENWNDNGAPAFDPNFVNQIEVISKRMILPPKVYPTAAESIQFEYDREQNMYWETDEKNEEYRIYYLEFEFTMDNKVKIFYQISYRNKACIDAKENALDIENPYQEFSKCLDFNDTTLKYMNALVNYLMHDTKDNQIKMLDTAENAMLYALNNSFENNGFNDLNNSQRITTRIYSSFIKNYYNVIEHVLWKGYYNMGTDSYSCNTESCEDIKFRFDKLKNSIAIWRGIAIITSIAFLIACIFLAFRGF